VLILAVVAAGMAGASSLLLKSRVERAFIRQPAVTCEGQLFSDGMRPVPFVERVARKVAGREAYLVLPEGAHRTSFAELGIELDVRETLGALRRTSPNPSFGERAMSLFRGATEPTAVLPVFSFDADRARSFLSRLAPELRREPVDARLDLAAHRRTPDAPGRELDVEATLAAIASGERRDGALFEPVFTTIPPAVTSDALLSVDVSKVLASYETDFSKKPRSRIPNIRLGASLLNGVVIGPGEVMSFNRVVGPRTVERGFRDAPVIVADELEQGLGGGICQVASTFFAAAMLGGLEIVSRRSHSRPSGYAPLGLDAVVIYPEVDLRVRNPYPVPLIVHAFLPNAKMIRVELLGLDPPGKFEHFFHVEARDAFVRRVAQKSELRPGTIDRRQEGYAGYDGKSTIVLTRFDGTRSARTYSSKYYPVPEVYWIAADVDPQALPELPQGASGVELTDDGTTSDGERGDAPEP
jgi:vancomycin resistance protein YoaR